MRLSDLIEEFIKDLWGKEETEVQLKRNELAEYFRCAPSQINYVLSTRFTPDHGYAIESFRGGGGFIRIVRLSQDDTEHLRYLTHERVGDRISANEARLLCLQLAEQGRIPKETADIMIAALSAQALCVPIPEALKDEIRAKTLRSMLLQIAQQAE
ncbi:MAG: CtsR family transcriptional regulator [Christensenellales bacterium]|jgi:transcriptional regulator CtsR|nr:CtsR family transcriptional regulator [Clostridiales bacterium]